MRTLVSPIRSLAIRPARTAIPRLLVAIAALQAGIALLAAGLDALGACGSCTRGAESHLAIALAGAAAYLVLAAAGWADWERLFSLGVAVASGVHTALAVWMATAHFLCLPCLASALGAGVLLALSIASGIVRIALIEKAALPALLATAGFAFLSMVSGEGRRRERDLALAELGAADSTAPRAGPPIVDGRIRMTVFEMVRCPYCEEFRREYLPRLTRDFGRHVDVVFQDSSSASWVRRTPTIVVERGPVFEGLPLSYADLYEAVAGALGPRDRQEK